MKLSVSAGSAITVLNAIRAPFGIAIGTDIRTIVTVETATGINYSTQPVQDTKLLSNIVQIFQQYTEVTVEDIIISTNSPLPPAKGLKTSSAVASATVRALANYYNIPLTIKEQIIIGAEASVVAGVSITGAIDDAYASTCGGIAYTKTETRELISLQDLPFTRKVALLIPQTSNPKTALTDLQVDAQLVQKAIKEFQNNNIEEAIRCNSLAYGPSLSADFTQIFAYNSNTTVIGLNGAGPSFFVLYDEFPNGLTELQGYDILHTTLRPLQEACK